jgi:hypothetical protein
MFLKFAGVPSIMTLPLVFDSRVSFPQLSIRGYVYHVAKLKMSRKLLQNQIKNPLKTVKMFFNQ